MIFSKQKLVEIRYLAYHDLIELKLKKDGMLWLQTVQAVENLTGCGYWESVWAEAILSKSQYEFFTWMGRQSSEGHLRRLRSPLMPLLTERERWLVLKGTCPTRVSKTKVSGKLAEDFEFKVLSTLDREFDGKRAPELTLTLIYLMGD